MVLLAMRRGRHDAFSGLADAGEAGYNNENKTTLKSREKKS
jgi:hypothetical protein